MADEYRITLVVEKNGQALDNMPIIRRLVVNEDAAVQIVAPADNDTTTYHPLAAAIMPTANIVLISTDSNLNISLNQNTPFALQANGLMLLFGTALAQATPADNIEYNNPAASGSGNITGVIAGT